MNASPESLICNCNTTTDATKLECQILLRQLLNRVNAKISNEFHANPERLANADLYSVTILFLFAGIILIILIRAIKPNQSLDDQVTFMMSSMRERCDYEDEIRHKMQLKKAKLKARRWINEVKMQSNFQIRKLSFGRSHSTEPKSVISSDTISLKAPCHRAASTGFVPMIVVTNSNEDDSSALSSLRPNSSRASSMQSLDEISQDSYALDAFMTNV